MAKYKPVRGKKKKDSNLKAIPCLILIVMGIVLLTLLFFGMLKSAS